MKKERDLITERNDRREQRRHTIEQQITKLAGMIEALLEGIKISELTSKERVLIAAQLTSLQQRAIRLEHILDMTDDDNSADLALITIARRMRGEVEEADNPRFIETNITIHTDDDESC